MDSVEFIEKTIREALKTGLKPKELKCPVCGSLLLKNEGCEKCYECGYSRCG